MLPPEEGLTHSAEQWGSSTSYCLLHGENSRKPKFQLRITAWFGLEGTLKPPSSNLPAMGRDTFHQTRLLRAPPNVALNTAREGAATASLGKLCQCLTTLIVKNFFLTSSLNLPSLSSKPSSLVLSLHTLVKSCYSGSCKAGARVVPGCNWHTGCSQRQAAALTIHRELERAVHLLI